MDYKELEKEYKNLYLKNSLIINEKIKSNIADQWGNKEQIGYYGQIRNNVKIKLGFLNRIKIFLTGSLTVQSSVFVEKDPGRVKTMEAVITTEVPIIFYTFLFYVVCPLLTILLYAKLYFFFTGEN